MARIQPDYGQSRAVIDYLDILLRGQHVPDDATGEDIMCLVRAFHDNGTYKWSSNYAVKAARIVGKGFPDDGSYDPFRITVIIGRIADGRAVVEDVTLG